MQFSIVVAAMAVTTLVAISLVESAELPSNPAVTTDRGDITGAMVAVMKDGSVLFQQGFGYGGVDEQVPMVPERSIIRPGSTSKPFTWSAVLRPVERGKITILIVISTTTWISKSCLSLQSADHPARSDEPRVRLRP
jgi:CubicO group peptidase (beta-lactamase class C family)